MTDTRSSAVDSQERVVLVGRFLTPLALILGGLAMVFAEADAVRKIVVLGLLDFAAFFNLNFAGVLSAKTGGRGGVVQFRLFLDLAINTVVVVLLGAAFPPLWLLLALTPFATAVYGHPREAWITAAVAAALLILIQAFRPAPRVADFAVQAARGAFIVFTALLINAVSRHARD